MRQSALVLAASLAVSGFAFTYSSAQAAGTKVAEDPTIAAREKPDKAAAKDQTPEQREKHELKKMPKVVQEALMTETKGGTDIDYYKLAGGEKVFGATFKDASGEPVDVRVDRQGKVINRLTGAAAVAAANPVAAPVTPAAQPAPATPAPATPATPTAPAATAQPAPATPGTATAGEFDSKKGDVQYDQLPAPVKAAFADPIKGAKDVRFYNAKEGAAHVYDGRFIAANGKDMSVRVDDSGKVVSSKEVTEDAQTASASESAANYVHLEELAAPAQASAKKLTAGAKDVRYFKDGAGYNVMYISADGVDHSAHIDTAGKVSGQKTIDLTTAKPSQDVTFWDLPDGVRATARTETKDGKNAKYERALLNGQRVWKIRFEDSKGKEMEVRTDDSGKVLSTHEVTDRDTTTGKTGSTSGAKPATSTKDSSKK